MKNSGTATRHYCHIENGNGAEPYVLDAAVLCCAAMSCLLDPCAVLSVRADAEEISYLIQIGSHNNCRKYDNLEIYFMLHWYIKVVPRKTHLHHPKACLQGTWTSCLCLKPGREVDF